MRPPLCPAIPLACLALSLAADSRADIIYSDLAYPLSGAGPLVIGTTAATELQLPFPFQITGEPIQPTANYAITDVTVFVSSDAGFTQKGQYSPNFNIWLYSDQEIIETIHGFPVKTFHEPKDPIIQIAQGLVAPHDPTLVTATAAPNLVFVKGGQISWIVLTPADPHTLVAWGTVDGPYPYYQAMQVEGTLVTPEPASLDLFFIALLGGVPLLRISKSRHLKQGQLSTQ